ncbi:ABC transporter ATP-binding protein [Sporolactobacillus shoreicorticis]|uniref:ABC transporter ATP-binding protein n=1 Tax=Sporolactobacillus shoreicorticis TaxID=1923877 RepID=A0ABW5S433_9BACL|nr:ABC transporter ATP-binding protein [Sporolactobacillus shoreicorticis]MCO7124420.1 ABC transporter ATP-binding protein [Sporolactobacillus shoreicorticis]
MSIKVAEVERTFGSFTALKHVNLTVEDGEFMAILGPSGCGKTTLLRLLAGFDAPSSGTIEMDGRVVGSPKQIVPPEKRNIGMVFQSFALWPHMNVRRHIEFPLMHHQFVSKALKKNMRQRADEVLKMIKLQDLAERMPEELSGGQRQRVALGRAIAPQPKLLLMDEPLSSLDAELRVAMRGELQEIHRLTGTSIIYVTHDQSEALAMADRIVVMNHGSVEQIGTPRAIYNHPQTSFVARFVGKANLVKGKWQGSFFSPQEAPDVHWEDHGVSEILKQESVYSLRPEQIEINQGDSGIPGEVANVQYQGKDIRYTVKTATARWQVDTDLTHNFHLGESVRLSIKSNL